MLRAISRRLTYANVIATLALFLALGGGAVWAASHKTAKIGAEKLKAGAVTTGKLRAGAVTTAKLGANSVTDAKLAPAAVAFTKLAPGTDVLATASETVAVDGSTALTPGFNGAANFTPLAGSTYFVSLEARSTNLARSGSEPCKVTIAPLVNGNEWSAGGPITLRAVEPSAELPSGLVPAGGVTFPVAIATTGVTQTIGARVGGDPHCSSTSTATIAVVLTRAK